MPLINLGQSELERRGSAAIVKQTKILGRISTGVALVALFVAVEGPISSARWEDQQIEILSRIEENTNVAHQLVSQSALLEKIEACAVQRSPVY